jgi:hypothetical protein
MSSSSYTARLEKLTEIEAAMDISDIAALAVLAMRIGLRRKPEIKNIMDMLLNTSI